MSGARHRQKGDRIEREIVERHRAIGVHAERYPLSGASRFRGTGHDIDIYAFGADQAPAVAEVKARKSGAGFVTLESWLGEYDCLFLRRNNADPLVVLPWRLWARLLEQGIKRASSPFGDKCEAGAYSGYSEQRKESRK
jgi:Holliday junction resolvase